MPANKCIIIFSGYNFRAIVAFMRFAEEQKIPFYVVSRSSDDPIYYTAFKKRVAYQRSNEDLNLELFKEISNSIAEEFSSHIILPSTEALNRYLIENVEELSQLGFIVPLADRDLYLTISNKASFGQLCANFNLKVPGIINADHRPYPFVAKPIKYNSLSGKRYLYPYLIFNDKDFESFVENEDLDDFYFQEFIDGRSYYLLYYFDNAAGVSSFGQENLIQQAAGKSIIAARYSDVFKKEISYRYIEMFQSIGFVGFVMVELKKMEEQYYMIEANPRLWGPSQLFLDSGSSIFHAFANDLKFQVSYPSQIFLDRNYFWSGGFVGSDTKVAFHSYCAEEFVRQYSSFLKSDLFLREDTINYYLKEIANGK